jgi:cytochrome c oxidase subunit II
LAHAAIFTMILVFALKYRRRRGIQAEQIEGSTALEVTWSVIPFGIFLVIVVWVRPFSFRSASFRAS